MLIEMLLAEEADEIPPGLIDGHFVRRRFLGAIDPGETFFKQDFK